MQTLLHLIIKLYTETDIVNRRMATKTQNERNSEEYIGVCVCATQPTKNA